MLWLVCLVSKLQSLTKYVIMAYGIQILLIRVLHISFVLVMSNNKIRVLQRRAYGIKDEEYLHLKALTCCLPEI